MSADLIIKKSIESYLDRKLKTFLMYQINSISV